jgi:hypothetical protein
MKDGGMYRSGLLILLLSTAIANANGAWAIHIESDHPGLQSGKARLVEMGRAAEVGLNGGATSMSSSGFTGFNAGGIKRKPFPPGYSRSGYEFEDEVLRAVAPPAPPAADAAKTGDQTPAPERKP